MRTAHATVLFRLISPHCASTRSASSWRAVRSALSQASPSHCRRCRRREACTGRRGGELTPSTRPSIPSPALGGHVSSSLGRCAPEACTQLSAAVPTPVPSATSPVCVAAILGIPCQQSRLRPPPRANHACTAPAVPRLTPRARLRLRSVTMALPGVRIRARLARPVKTNVKRPRGNKTSSTHARAAKAAQSSTRVISPRGSSKLTATARASS